MTDSRRGTRRRGQSILREDQTPDELIEVSEGEYLSAISMGESRRTKKVGTAAFGDDDVNVRNPVFEVSAPSLCAEVRSTPGFSNRAHALSGMQRFNPLPYLRNRQADTFDVEP